MITVFMDPLGNDGNGWGKRLTIHRSPPQLKSSFNEPLHGTQISAHPSPIWRDLSICFFPRHGTLNENGTHKPIGDATPRKCGLFGVDVIFLEEMCHWGEIWGFKYSSHAQCYSLNVEFSAISPVSSVPYLPVCLHTSYYDDAFWGVFWFWFTIFFGRHNSEGFHLTFSTRRALLALRYLLTSVLICLVSIWDATCLRKPLPTSPFSLLQMQVQTFLFWQEGEASVSSVFIYIWLNASRRFFNPYSVQLGVSLWLNYPQRIRLSQLAQIMMPQETVLYDGAYFPRHISFCSTVLSMRCQACLTQVISGQWYLGSAKSHPRWTKSREDILKASIRYPSLISAFIPWFLGFFWVPHLIFL